MNENDDIEKRRHREMRTISQMIALYCRDKHVSKKQDEIAHCGELVCVDCHDLDRYAVAKTQKCMNMRIKTTCEQCIHHCYKPEKRLEIREIMRYSGPRMAKRHPISAIRHLMQKKTEP